MPLDHGLGVHQRAFIWMITHCECTEKKTVSIVAETVLKRETVQEVTVDRNCRISGAPD